jgi:hypothetical protein
MNWFPSNARLAKEYNKKGPVDWNNFKFPLNVVPGTGTRNAVFREAINATTASPGVIIGTPTAFGVVRRFANGFVTKTMAFKNTKMDYLKVFLNEVRVGSSPGIEKAGPKIHAWRVHRNSVGTIKSAEYIMDDYEAGLARSEKAMKMSAYMKRFRGGACPLKGDPIFQKLKSTMETFWRVTKGYHGDLHTNNLAVVVDVFTNEPKRVIVFDYGAHRPFKNPPPDSACFKDYISLINKEFRATFHKRKQVRRTLGNTLNQTVYPGRNQPFRSNAMMLNRMKTRSTSKSRTPSILQYISNRTHVSQTPLRRQAPPPKKRRRLYVRSASTTRSPQPAGTASHVSETPLSRQRKRSKSP